MPRLITLALFVCLYVGLAALAKAHAAPLRHVLPSAPSELPRVALPPFEPPRPERVELGSAVALLLPERELPLVSGWCCFRGGALDEPAERIGLYALLGEALREGGSRSEDGEALDAWLDERAASIEVHVDRDSVRIGFAALAADLPLVLQRIAGLLGEPAYPQEALERARGRLLAGIARRDDNASGMADRALVRLAYGPRSPYAREATSATAGAITRDDLLAAHARIFQRTRLVAGCSGDFERAAALDALRTLLATLPEGTPAAAPPQPQFDVPERSRLWLLDRPGVPQCELRLAAPGLSRRDPRYPAAYLWSHAVGLGMTSRMMARVRTELGLAYSVGAIFRPEWNVDGRLYAWCGTRNDAAARALTEMIEQLQQALLTELPQAELDAARERLQNAEIFRIDTPQKVLQRALDLELYGLPPDFHERVLARVRELSPREVQQAVASLAAPQQLIAVAVGPLDEIRPGLEQVLETLVLPRTDAPRTDAAGAALAARMLDALGGADAWRALERLSCTEVRGEAAAVTTVRIEQDACGTELRWDAEQRAGSDTRQVSTEVDARGGRRSGALGPGALDAAATAEARRNAQRSLWSLCARLARGDAELHAQAASDTRLELWSDRERVAVLELDASGQPLTLAREPSGALQALALDGYVEVVFAAARRVRLPSHARSPDGALDLRWSGWNAR
jgi:zinc protease